MMKKEVVLFGDFASGCGGGGGSSDGDKLAVYCAFFNTHRECLVKHFRIACYFERSKPESNVRYPAQAMH